MCYIDGIYLDSWSGTCAYVSFYKKKKKKNTFISKPNDLMIRIQPFTASSANDPQIMKVSKLHSLTSALAANCKIMVSHLLQGQT